MDAMYPHIITVWRPRSSGRAIAWEELGTMSCRVDMERPTTASTSGDDASWEASILIPSIAQPLQRHDKVAVGDINQVDPPADAFKVVRCDPISLDSQTPNHWEAIAK